MSIKDYEREYDVYAFFVPPSVQQPYTRAKWLELCTELECLEELLPSPFALRGSGYRRKEDGFYKGFGYGKRSLKASDAEKWVQPDDYREHDAVASMFGHIEGWSPHWGKCFYGSPPPDAYFCLRNTFPSVNGINQCSIYKCTFLCALATEFEIKASFIGKKIAHRLECRFFFHRQLFWGADLGDNVYTSCIQDGLRDIEINVRRAVLENVDWLDLMRSQHWNIREGSSGS